MQDADANLTDAGWVLSYDGRTHVLIAADGSWQIRMELEQLGAGEVIGVGSVRTTTHAADAEVIVSGHIDEREIAVATLLPVMPCRLEPITLVVRVARRSEVQDPVVSEVLEVRGLPVRA